MLRPSTHAALALFLAAVWSALALGILHAAGPVWSLYPPATCLGTHCFCELPRTGALLLQPANTVSSLGFVIVGAWIMLDAVNAHRRALGVAATLLMGLCAIIIGVGSVLLHATLTLWGQFADVVGMYLFGSFLIVWALRRGIGWSDAVWAASYVALAGLCILLLWIAPETRRWLFAIILVAAIALEWWLARPHRQGVAPALFLVGLLANTVAFALWILDQALIVCAADSWWQGHAAWHLLGAVAVGCSFAYLRGEDIMPA
ncbi:ceramidase domain-containing protein [Sandarakinorhabdus sp. DWP1-3-1]|uniref:ceramidase domain-containing protein n=1 Tax=Sandarakinorhabdus sp. DWP1-3-1 TaxID=2804627 RepID=UPI003CEF2189